MTAEFKAMMENTDDYIYFKDRNHVFTAASQTLVPMTNPSEHWTDLLGQTDYDVFPEHYADSYYRLEKQVFAGLPVAHEIQETLDLHGNKGWVDNRKYPILNDRGVIVGLFGIARDITRQKLAEQALHDSEETLRESQRTAGLGSFILDIGKDRWSSSDILDQLLGIDAHYPRNLADWLALIHPDDSDAIKQQLHSGLSGKKEFCYQEYRIVRACDREQRWVRNICRLERNAQGHPASIRGTLQDITESREEHLAEQRAILGNQMVGMAAVREHKIVWANAALETMLGYASGELTGMPVRLFYSSEKAYLASVPRCEGMNDRKVTHSVQACIRKNGQPIWVDKSAALLHPETHEYLWTFIDITQRKQAENALRESESRFRIMADHAPVLIWLSAQDQLCTWFNKKWLDFTGRGMEQELGNGWTEGVHRDDFQHYLEVYNKAFNARREFAMEYRLRRYDGEYRWILDHGAPRFDEQGGFSGYIGSCIDISERKTMEQALAASETKFRRLFEDNSSVMLLIEPVSGLIVDANQAASVFYGYSLKQLIGMPVGVIDALPPETWQLEKQRATNRECNHFFCPHRLASGELRDVEVHSTPIEAKDKPLLLSIVHDITDRKRAEEQLMLAASVFTHANEGIIITTKRGHHHRRQHRVHAHHRLQPRRSAGEKLQHIRFRATNPDLL